jgi:ribokinase
VLGSVNMDLVLRCPRLPGPGETLAGRDFRTEPGGKGANQAVAAARLGAAAAAPVSFIGCVGDDAFGHAARAALASEGIDTRHLHTLAGVATGVAMIFVDDAGRNCIGLAAGANAQLTTGHVDQAGALIDHAAMLVCQLESPLPVVWHAIERAHRAGVPVLLNPAPAQALPADLAAMVTWLLPNQGEAAMLAGMPADADIGAIAQRLAALGFADVIVTLGERGVGLASAGRVKAFAAHAVRAIDTTGAGDTFAAAFAVATSEGRDAPAAIGFAQRAAAISVTRNGAMASMPRRDEIDHEIDLDVQP